MNQSRDSLQYDPVQSWIDGVARSHSQNKSTPYKYKSSLKMFCEFIGKSPAEILDDFSHSTDRDFKHRYAQYLNALASALSKKYAPNSINTTIAAVQSFFTHNDLPVGYVPAGRKIVVYHNRAIEKDEIIAVLSASKPRERAFYIMMAQSGLRPDSLCKLQVKDIEPDILTTRIEAYTVTVPLNKTKGAYTSYWTFIGEDTANALKAYWSTSRPNITPESLLFTAVNSETKPANPKSVSALFTRTLRRLRKSGNIKYKQSKRWKPSELRLYNLRKYFRNTIQVGPEYWNWWMGHLSAFGTDLHYVEADKPKHLQVYIAKALPYLRLESHTPIEAERAMIEKTEEVDIMKQQFIAMNERLVDLQRTIENISQFNQRIMKLLTPKQKDELENMIKEETAAGLEEKPKSD